MLILLDHSGSMVDNNKWTSASMAVKQFSSTSSGVSAGLQFMPSPAANPPPTTCTVDADCGVYGPCVPGFNICQGGLAGATDSCIPADYAKPAVGFDDLPANAGRSRPPSTRSRPPAAARWCRRSTA